MAREQKNMVSVDELEMINGYICMKRTGDLFTGTYYSEYENVRIGEDVEVEEGRRHGVLKMYNEEGTQIVEAHFFRGNKHGKLTLWYDNGMKKSEVTMQWGLREGVMKVWYEDGALKIHGYYRKDMLHGTQKKYFPNGRLRMQIDFRDDVEHGFKTIWDEAGNIIFEGRYINGERM